MKGKEIKIFFIADIVGKPGLEITERLINEIKNDYTIDMIVANGENVCKGKGISPDNVKSLFAMGVNVITSGNHIWNQNKIYPELGHNDRILRPANYPSYCPGKGVCVFDIPAAATSVGVINLQGRSFMQPIDCPFTVLDKEIQNLSQKNISVILVDFHAEATAEKQALGWYADGRVSAVIGTHTHVQTADERLLPKGTAYISDAGMTGAIDSVIGMDTECSIKRFRTQMPVKYQAATENKWLNGVVVTINRMTGNAISIQRISLTR